MDSRKSQKVTFRPCRGSPNMARRLPWWLILVPSVGASSLAAQTQLGAGVAIGSAKLSDQRSERALSSVLQLQANPWLTLSAVPSFVHVSDLVKGSTISSSGIADLPLSAAIGHTFPGAGAPTIASALTIVLPTGNASCGLGSGATSAGLDIGFAATPRADVHVSADASRTISHVSSQSTLSAPRATSLLLGGGYDVSPTWRADISLGVDVGQVDSTQALSRVIGGGVSHRVGGSIALTLDASAGLTAGSPKWVISLGLGSVFAGASPVGLSAPLKRLRSGFTGGVNRGSGKIGC